MVTADSAADVTLLTGTPYRFVRLIARGGMSTVVEAVHSGSGMPVVVKLLPDAHAESPELADRLRVEAQALGRLRHENLVEVLDFGISAGGVPYLVMERLRGRSLQDELDERGALPIAEALELSSQLLAGLALAHAAGLVHRDVKPGNVFVCDATAPGTARTVKLLDFGIAKVLAEAELAGLVPMYRTQEGVRLGTPRYIAPEQIRAGVITPATDVYAAGLVVYRMITGRHAFAHHTGVDELYRAQLLEMPPAPSSVAEQAISREIDRVVLRAIAKAPADRYANAGELAAELASAASSPPGERAPDSRSAQTLATSSTLVTEPPRPPRPAPPISRRHDVLAAICTAVGVIGVLIALVASVSTTQALFDPTRTALSFYDSLPPDAIEHVELYGRLIAVVDLLRGAVIAIAAASLIAISLRVLSGRPAAVGMLRTWSSWAIGAVAVAFAIDLTALGLRWLMMSELPSPDDENATLLGVGYAIAIVAVFLVPAVQLGFVLLVRRFSRQT